MIRNHEEPAEHSLPRVLVIAYFFPPLGGGGVQRTVAFTKYLPEFGWEPTVIAPRNPGYEVRDPGSLDRIPGSLDVRRSWSPEPWWAIFRRAQRLVRRLRPRGVQAADATRLSGPSHSRAVRLAAHVFFPDDHVTWIPFAVRSALATHRVRRASAIISTSPPVSGHLIAGIVARRTGVPWIADFRDPWIGNPFAPRLGWAHRRAQSWLERWIVSSAARVVAVTPSMATAFRERYPEARDRILTITNGYDRSELPRVDRDVRSDGRFRLVYSGSVYGRILGTFLAGLERFLQSDSGARERLHVEFQGWMDAESTAASARFLATSPFRDVVTFIGHKPRTDAIARVAAADAALYLLGDDPGKEMFIGGKLLEYIGIGLPILAIVPLGDSRWVLESLAWGVIAEPTVEGVADGLERLLRLGARATVPDPEGRFDRRRLTGELAQVLNEVSDG